MALYHKYRPDSLDKLVGQPEAVKCLQRMIEEGNVPHAILLTGPSGCGKTSIARVLKKELNCSDNDFCEMNASEVRGIDAIRELKDRMGRAPWGGDSRIYLLDEAHGLTKDAQEALLKVLEDTPSHVYMLLATTLPNKLLPTIRNRCTPVTVKPLNTKNMEELLRRVVKGEKQKISDEVLEKIVDTADGSPRKALVMLEQVFSLDDEDEQLNVVKSADSQKEAIEICRELNKPRPRWDYLAEIVRGVEDDPEGVRRLVLAYFTTMLLKGSGNSGRYAYTIECFRDNYFDTGKSGLALSCYQACQPRS